MTNRFLAVLGCALLLGISGTAISTTASAAQQTAPDNSKTNQRDRSGDQPTADQQKENSTDRDITQKIRRSIEEDKALSTYAHNVKIITQDGHVTLRGPVNSAEEKRSVNQKAVAVAGAGNVTNEIEIATKQNQ